MSVATGQMDALRERIRLAPGKLIAGRIRQARKEMRDPDGRPISHDSFGRLLGGVTRQHLIKLEKAQHRPRPEMLLRISEASNKPLDFFLVEESGEPNPFPEAA